VKIEIFGTPVCGQCKDVISYLLEHNEEYDYKLIGRDISPAELSDYVGRTVRSAPVIVVDGNEVDFNALRECVPASIVTEELAESLSALSI
jgi:glutaredoxin